MKTLTSAQMDTFIHSRMLFATSTKAEWAYRYINEKPIDVALHLLTKRTTQQKRAAHNNSCLTEWIHNDDIEMLFTAGLILAHAVEFPHIDNTDKRNECVEGLNAAVRIWCPQTVANVLAGAYQEPDHLQLKRFVATLAKWTNTPVDMWTIPFKSRTSPYDLLSPELLNLLKCSAALGVPLTHKIDADILELPTDSLGPTT